jgi:Ca2+-binding RTX toxin-like protein
MFMSTLQRWVKETGTNLAMIGTMFLVSVFPILSATPVAHAIATPQWNLVGNFNITFTCTAGCTGDHPHAANIAIQNNTTGDFSGTGNYIGLPSYTWNIAGNTVDSSLTYTIIYTGTLAGYTLNGTGTIDENGDLSGTAVANWFGQTFTWKNVTNHAREIVGNGVKPAECTGTYANVIQGTNSADVLNGTSGSDLIFGYGGNDKITGAASDDCIVGGTGVDTIDGGSGNDVVFGRGGNDKLSGGSGNDTVFVGLGNDTVNGNAGNDSLTGDTGTDSTNGGTGIDSCSAETQVSC